MVWQSIPSMCRAAVTGSLPGSALHGCHSAACLPLRTHLLQGALTKVLMLQQLIMVSWVGFVARAKMSGYDITAHGQSSPWGWLGRADVWQYMASALPFPRAMHPPSRFTLAWRRATQLHPPASMGRHTACSSMERTAIMASWCSLPMTWPTSWRHGALARLAWAPILRTTHKHGCSATFAAPASSPDLLQWRRCRPAQPPCFVPCRYDGTLDPGRLHNVVHTLSRPNTDHNSYSPETVSWPYAREFTGNCDCKWNAGRGR